jgi:YVTN family beta-propeller protein
VAVIDTASQKVIKVLQAGSDPEQFALSPDGKRLFVANEDAALASVVEVGSGAVVARIKVGREPEGVVMSPDGQWVLVSNESDNSVSVIDIKTLKEVNHVTVGKRPRDMAFTPDGKAAYVSGEMDASLYRMSVPKGAVERVVQLRPEARPMSVLLDARRNRLYMSTGRGGTVAVIDITSAPKLIKEVTVGKRPWGIALSADGRFLYTANGPSNDMSIVDTTTLTTIKTVAAGKSPWGVVVGPAPKPIQWSKAAKALRYKNPRYGFPRPQLWYAACSSSL